jgi:hypothetical protein
MAQVGRSKREEGVLKHNPVDRIGIQATGLKVKNQAKTPESPDLENPSD